MWYFAGVLAQCRSNFDSKCQGTHCVSCILQAGGRFENRLFRFVLWRIFLDNPDLAFAEHRNVSYVVTFCWLVQSTVMFYLFCILCLIYLEIIIIFSFFEQRNILDPYSCHILYLPLFLGGVFFFYNRQTGTTFGAASTRNGSARYLKIAIAMLFFTFC